MLATRDVAKVAMPFLASLVILTGAQCVDGDGGDARPGEPPTSGARDARAAGPSAPVTTEETPSPPLPAITMEQDTGGAICVTQDGAPYESDAC